ncbi:GIY-YIG nuclease family protein [Phenylobacterium sp. 20VBR1]|uniref:GIY-YIG nuclease family protein n=1 Tax=Phenylobacterium glaciei TaxID=2803784 RepID=A0A941D2F3_9CAUL|nr:GIY-YIG nuclease family protein [Phenylobacterium glaciei]MBR7620159.1 GIY-YIG nuclease family protein [Phenylobacterium glaciei]QQZ49039.1 GIY-YIG nuclease family protein [Phenylobacterium glaciei]
MFYTYILASQRNGTLYTGSTDNLAKRLFEHREKIRRGFTAKYGVDKLVWFEAFELRENAFRRERRIKEWRRAWKLRLIEEMNPDWRDLGDDLNNLLGI